MGFFFPIVFLSFERTRPAASTCGRLASLNLCTAVLRVTVTTERCRGRVAAYYFLCASHEELKRLAEPRLPNKLAWSNLRDVSIATYAPVVL